MFPEDYSPEFLDVFLKAWGFTVKICEKHLIPTNVRGQQTEMLVILVHAALSGTEDPKHQDELREHIKKISEGAFATVVDNTHCTLERLPNLIYQKTGKLLTHEECLKISTQPGGILRYVKKEQRILSPHK